MKKLNNKGFAITTLLYGLLSVAFLIMSLLIGIMSTNRQNTSTLVKTIEEELNRYGESETTFAYVGELQEYIVPYGQAGWYKIELWGAKSNVGNGDYVSGIVYLEENTTLHFYLGSTCTTSCTNVYNQANTEVRIVPTASTQWNDAESIRSTIMRAGSLDSTNTTSYVSGMAGMNSVNASGSLTNQTNHYSGYFFINGLYIPDSNNGNGMANVELVSTNAKSNPPTKKVTSLNSVRYIRACSSGSSTNTGNHIVELQAINLSDGSNLAKGKTISNTTSNSVYATNGLVNSSYANLNSGNSQCTVLDLGSIYTLSEIGLWQYYTDARTYYNQTIEVSTNNSTWTFIKNKSTANKTATKESVVGTRITAWQPDTTTTLPAGNYYIMSTIANNIALTAQNARQVTSPNKANVTTEIFTGSKLQKWTVEPVGGAGVATVYKIYETENLHALQIQEGTAETSENANAAETYRGYAWDQWYILPQGNGTYKIQSLLGTYLNNSDNGTTGNVNMGGTSTSDTTFSNRWRFINAEY